MRKMLCIVLLTAVTFVHAQDSKGDWFDQPLDSMALDLEKLLLNDLDSTLQLIDGVIAQARNANDKLIEAKLRRIQIAALWQMGNYDPALDSINSSLQLINSWNSNISEDEKDSLEMLAMTIVNERGRLYGRLGKHKQASEAYQQNIDFLEKRKQTNYIKQRLAAMNANMAVSYKAMGMSLDSVIMMYEKSLSIFKELGDPYYMSVISLNMGISVKLTGDYTRALDLFLYGLNIAEANKLNVVPNFYISLISLYKSLKDVQSATHYSNKVITLAEEKKNQPMLAYGYVTMGSIYMDQKDNDSAIYYFQKSLVLSEQINDIPGKADALQLLSKAYLWNEDYKNSLATANRGLKVMENHNDFFIELHLLLWKSNALMKLNQLDQAKAGINKALKMVEGTGNNKYKRNVFEFAHELFATMGNHRQAYEYLGHYSIYQDSVLAEEKTLEIARVEFDFQLKTETEKLELEKRQQAALYEKELEKERLIQYSAFGGGALVLFILIILYRSYQLKKQKNHELTEKNIQISDLRETEKKMAEETLALKERELTTITMLSHERNTLLEQLGSQIGNLSEKVDDEVIPDLKEIKRTINSNLSAESWSSFMYQFEKVHPDFFNLLKNIHPTLTQNDLRICAYLRVGMEKKGIATVSNTTPEAVKKSLYRLKKKMELDANTDLREYLMKLSNQ